MPKNIDIKQLRQRLNLTQDQMAKLLNISKWTVFRLEKGINKPHPLLQEKLEKLAKQLKKGDKDEV